MATSSRTRFDSRVGLTIARIMSLSAKKALADRILLVGGTAAIRESLASPRDPTSKETAFSSSFVYKLANCAAASSSSASIAFRLRSASDSYSARESAARSFITLTT